jgi:hypothetical protein
MASLARFLIISNDLSYEPFPFGRLNLAARFNGAPRVVRAVAVSEQRIWGRCSGRRPGQRCCLAFSLAAPRIWRYVPSKIVFVADVHSVSADKVLRL